MQIISTFKLVQINQIYQLKHKLPQILRIIGRLNFQIDALLTFDDPELPEHPFPDHEFSTILHQFVSKQIYRIRNGKLLAFPAKKHIKFGTAEPVFWTEFACVQTTKIQRQIRTKSSVLVTPFSPQNCKIGCPAALFDRVLGDVRGKLFVVNGVEGSGEVWENPKVKVVHAPAGRILVIDFVGSSARHCVSYGYEEGPLGGDV
ncbi:hypothetical protein SS50377_21812 [Spironucleus salmonicida]|uniref:Uncharacterized protein n=1 Tax=Spironucleus salmonicida TaxID=348837 RepID=V6LJN0_9EUKA|nr:hypothetical protein SS50377_21812 [Spironucleus salmonicida]|eukprot:EST44800.1 Hypothetical protein SS50377_15309 [Spironucleus salmonicida]